MEDLENGKQSGGTEEEASVSNITFVIYINKAEESQPEA